jgi:hypothetical protein
MRNLDLDRSEKVVNKTDHPGVILTPSCSQCSRYSPSGQIRQHTDSVYQPLSSVPTPEPHSRHEMPQPPKHEFSQRYGLLCEILSYLHNIQTGNHLANGRLQRRKHLGGYMKCIQGPFQAGPCHLSRFLGLAESGGFGIGCRGHTSARR